MSFVSSPSGVQGGAPAAIAFSAYCRPKIANSTLKKWWWQSPPVSKVVVTSHHRRIQSCAYGCSIETAERIELGLAQLFLFSNPTVHRVFRKCSLYVYHRRAGPSVAGSNWDLFSASQAYIRQGSALLLFLLWIRRRSCIPNSMILFVGVICIRVFRLSRLFTYYITHYG